MPKSASNWRHLMSTLLYRTKFFISVVCARRSARYLTTYKVHNLMTGLFTVMDAYKNLLQTQNESASLGGGTALYPIPLHTHKLENLTLHYLKAMCSSTTAYTAAKNPIVTPPYFGPKILIFLRFWIQVSTVLFSRLTNKWSNFQTISPSFSKTFVSFLPLWVEIQLRQ